MIHAIAEAPNIRVALDSLSSSVQKILLTSLVEYILILFTPLYLHNHDPNPELPSPHTWVTVIILTGLLASILQAILHIGIT